MTDKLFSAQELIDIHRAYEFAKRAHAEINQVRKYTGQPYIVHPLEVANILLREVIDIDAEMIQAALLHDVVEDTPVTQDDIYNAFGHDVSELVEGLTDVSKKEDGNREFRKAMDREHTAKQDARCKTIKLADLIHNSRDITKYDPDFAVVYMKEKKLLLEVLKEGDDHLWHRANHIVTIWETRNV